MGITTDLNINIVPISPQLKDVLDYFKKHVKLDLNCHHLGTVKKFNAADQTATVEINYQKAYQTTENGVQSIRTESYPLALQCPVVILGGGDGYLSFPIEEGHECLLLFNDRDIDNWFNGSSNSPPKTGRLHSFADAVALVGLRSKAKVIEDYQGEAVRFYYKGKMIEVFDSKVLVTLSENVTLELNSIGKLKINNSTGEFVSILDSLLKDIQSATTNTLLGAQPLIMPTFAANLLEFESFKE